MLVLLALTADSEVIEQLKTVAQVQNCTSIKEAKTFINVRNGEFNYVVIGEPYLSSEEINKLKHPAIIRISNQEELDLFLNQCKESHSKDISVDLDSLMQRVQPHKKEDDLRQEPSVIVQTVEAPKVNLKDLGRVLLVTTNIELARYLAVFDTRIATTKYSAQKALKWNPRIIIWDIPEEKMEVSGALIYRWGVDLKHLEEIQVVLENSNF
jgi:arsenate reductase-like glutaredoxin family protein